MSEMSDVCILDFDAHNIVKKLSGNPADHGWFLIALIWQDWHERGLCVANDVQSGSSGRTCPLCTVSVWMGW